MKIHRIKLSAIALTLGLSSHAQLKLPVTNNDLRTNLQKVINGFPTHFETLKGDVLVDNPQSVEYASMLDFKTAEENSITQYKASRPIYSWQATILHTEEFEDAAKKYKWLYGQLKQMTVNLESGYSFTLTGTYDAPTESKKFSTSTFRLTPSASNMPKLKIEVSMQFEFPEWKVGLLVFEKEREDNERGQTKEDE
jgi:hypothetical protein